MTEAREAARVIPFPLKPKPRPLQEGDVVMMRDRRAVVTEPGPRIVGVRVDSPLGGTYDTFCTVERLRLMERAYEGLPCDVN